MKHCPICKNKNFKKLYQIGSKKIVRCIECDLVRTLGKPSVSYEEYHRDEVYDEFDKLFKNIFQKRLNLILKYSTKKGRVLDIGSSTGAMLEILKDKGWEVTGVEPSGSADMANERGVKTIKKTFEKAKLRHNYFDVVILNHTLEHVDDPVVVFRKAHKVLKKGGILFVDVPNFGGMSSKIKGKKWPFLLPEEHLYQFTPKTLKNVFEKAGFEVIKYRTQSGIFEYANPMYDLFLSLTTFKKRFFTNLLGSPFSLVATALNQGASLSMVGKKV